MVAKRPKLELPSMDMLRVEKEQEKSVVSEVKDHLKVLKEAKVQDLSVRRLKKLTEENKITWLLAAHGIRTICSVCSVMRPLPVGMTHVQRIRAIVCLASVTENEATFMDEFITEECPSLLEVCTSKIAILDFGVDFVGGGNLSIVIIVLSQVLNNNLVPDFARYYHPATITSPLQLKILYETLV